MVFSLPIILRINEPWNKKNKIGYRKYFNKFSHILFIAYNVLHMSRFDGLYTML